MTTTDGTLYLIANNRAGTGRARAVVKLARRLCDRAQRELHSWILERPKQLNAVLREVREAVLRDGGRVIVVGGDGTLRSVAQQLVGTAVPLAVVPTGTFNFFARNLGVPVPIQAALELAIHGTPAPVTVGEVNGRIFLNNASFGLYSRLIRARESHTRRYGRHQLVALLSTLYAALKGHRTMQLDLCTAQQRRRVLSPMVFVGINTLQLRGLSVEFAQCCEQQRMTVVVMNPVGRGDLFRLIFRGLLRRLADESSLKCFCVDRLSIDPDRQRITVVLDGERMRLQAPLNFGRGEAVLQVVQPPVLMGRHQS